MCLVLKGLRKGRVVCRDGSWREPSGVYGFDMHLVIRRRIHHLTETLAVPSYISLKPTSKPS